MADMDMDTREDKMKLEDDSIGPCESYFLDTTKDSIGTNESYFMDTSPDGRGIGEG